MTKVPSVTSLHLRYRLWIAELNNDITLLRIFEDYLNESNTSSGDEKVQTTAEDFKKKFTALRNEIDDLRHDMHLMKMKLAALSREKKDYTEQSYKEDNNEQYENRYHSYRKDFDTTKSDFMNFEGKWLS